ncbi:MAG: 50S ribosomal protein L13 [Candidatus Pelagibacterales bacterium]|jgi:large subunit ribosomal protein L13|tara:strand:- start:1426 stop:1890 length:465 start_codon:yes stop_codon:yes gene_type:complete
MATSKIIKQTASLRKEDVDKKWIIIDAEGIVLGRLASKVAVILRGKHKPSFTPHADCGDYVIIINAEKIKLTGKKLDGKIYYWHTGHPGGIKSRTARQIIEGRFPDRVIRLAVKRMIPKGPLGSQQLSNMKVYAGTDHPHAAQAPKVLNISEML